MSHLLDLSTDELLAQATCAVIIDSEIKGTAWLFSKDGHLLTAGHILGTDSPLNEVEVRFAEDAPHKAHKVQWNYQRQTGIDFAILKLAEPLADRCPLPISLAPEVTGTFKVHGYGVTLIDQAVGIGKFLGPHDPQDSPSNRLFELESKQLGEEGFSGSAVFSDDLQAAVAMQIEATLPTVGPMRDTILAMPLYRVAQLWAPFSKLIEKPRAQDIGKPQKQGISPGSAGNPFRGLRPFNEQDAELFSYLGRSGEVNEILDWLKDPNTRAVIVYGEPGVGKTSLIQAGVLPHVEDQCGLTFEKLAPGDLDPDDPRITSRIRQLEKLGRNLLVCDQFECWYEQSERSWRAVMELLTAVMKETKIKLLIGIRWEYVHKLDTKKYFPDRKVVESIELHYLNREQAVSVITHLTGEVFSREAAEKLVAILSESAFSYKCEAPRDEPRPYAPYIQMVCQRLWRDLVFEQGRSKITPSDFGEEQVRRFIDGYLEDNVPQTKPPELGPKILRSIVKRGHTGAIVPNPMTVEAIAQEIGGSKAVVHSFVQELRERDLVYLHHANGDQVVQIMNDFLGEVICNKYNAPSVMLRQASDSLIESLGIILRTEMRDADRERNILSFAQDFLKQRYSSYVDDLTTEEQAVVLDHLTLQSDLLKGLLGSFLESGQENRVCLVIDVLYQLLLMLKAYDRADALGHDFVRLVREKLTTKSSILLQKTYQVNHALLWQALVNGNQRDEASADFRHMQDLLRLAQQEREYTIVELRDRFREREKDTWVTRLILWRVLFRLWREGEVREPLQSEGWPPIALFSYEWVLTPRRQCLERYRAVEDRRTYQGVIVHIPAGEHAMRNQRVARQLLIRTVAVERSSRTTAPGWHEADDKKTVDSYSSDEDIYKLLYTVAQDYAVMLNKGRMMWVVLEAQEYPIKNMVEICQRVNERLKREEHAEGTITTDIEGTITTDIGASIANRKDLTRGLAALAGIPQPPYHVLAVKPEETWRRIWQAGIEHKGAAKWLPENWDALSGDEQRQAWLCALREAVETVGGTAMVKPVTTEFLKGATPVELTDDDLELAWERAKKKEISFPSVVVEKLIPNIHKEMLVIVVQRPDGSYVRVPPVWYRCVRDFDWRADKKHQSIPVAMDYAWVHRESRQEDDKETRKNLVEAQCIFEKARDYSQKMAEYLWDEIEYAGHKVNNRFLEFEWLVLDNGELMLNEIKPTQLDKGIISNVAFTHSDSELLVRNLFRLPLPDEVRLIQPRETVVCGAVLTKNNQDVEMITKGRLLIGYEGISEVLKLGAAVCLYPDKMRSIPYIGRRMGILTVSANNLEDAERIFQEARTALTPQYEYTA